MKIYIAFQMNRASHKLARRHHYMTASFTIAVADGFSKCLRTRSLVVAFGPILRNLEFAVGKSGWCDTCQNTANLLPTLWLATQGALDAMQQWSADVYRTSPEERFKKLATTSHRTSLRANTLCTE